MTTDGKDTFPRQFGKYHLLAPLAQGGMGALYIAVTGDCGLERLLVIKTVLPHLADDEYVARFRDEAKVVVQLSHQNLIPVFDAGQVDGELFLAMDLVEGKDLRAIWNRCAKKAVAFPLDVAAFVIKELCRGLGFAHGHGGLELVHRDVSPPNVIISYAGEVKLTDFGLAASTLKLEKTAPGIVYGKVSYMSPEQARGERLDGRSDLYTAGIILWELLTGRQLYPASPDQGQDLVDRSGNPVVPRPSERAPRVPPELDDICLKALAPRPEDRYQDGEAFRDALGMWLAGEHPSTDAARVESFLGELFEEDIAAERAHRKELLARTRERVSTLPPSHELHRLFTGLATEDLDRRQDDGPNLGRRGADLGEPAERRSEGGRRTIDKLAEGVGTMLGLPSGPAAGGEALAAEAVLLTRPKTEPGPLIGAILDGRYRIDELIGEGGMGRVYQAEHVDIGRTVAIKILHPVYNHMPDLVERFRREARAATKIGHPNIVDVTDSGTTDDGSTYFVMEYLDGVELASVIDKEGALEVGRVIAISTQICRALAAAHAVDIIHRDLKPENIFLTNQRGSSDFVKVLDFGIAKSGEAEKARERKLTSPGVAMGTPEYMAPEQAAGKPADERCDIYAVGAILYEMLSGVPPYEGENFMEILSRKATADPAPLTVMRPDVPRELADLVTVAMARDPQDRPRSMEALEYELTKLGSGRGVAVANAIGLSSEMAAVSPPSSNPPGRAASDPGLTSDTTSTTNASFTLPGELTEAEPITGVTSERPSTARGAVETQDSGFSELATAPPAPFAAASEDDQASPPARGASSALWVLGLIVLGLLAAGLTYVIVKEPGEKGQKPRAGAGAIDAGAAVAVPDAARAAVVIDAGKTGTSLPGVDAAGAAGNAVDAGRAADTSKNDGGKTGNGGGSAKKPGPSAKALFAEANRALNSGQMKAAEKAFRKAMAAGGSSSRGFLGLARVAFNQGQFDAAIKHGKRAGGSIGAQLLLGNAYERKRNCAQATTHYKRALAKDKASKAAMRGIERCK